MHRLKSKQRGMRTCYLYATGWIGSHRSALVMANLSRLQQDGVIQEPNSSVVVVEQHLPPFKPFQRF